MTEACVGYKHCAVIHSHSRCLRGMVKPFGLDACKLRIEWSLRCMFCSMRRERAPTCRANMRRSCDCPIIGKGVVSRTKLGRKCKRRKAERWSLREGGKQTLAEAVTLLHDIHTILSTVTSSGIMVLYCMNRSRLTTYRFSLLPPTHSTYYPT
jgi:hypothetical protein